MAKRMSWLLSTNLTPPTLDRTPLPYPHDKVSRHLAFPEDLICRFVTTVKTPPKCSLIVTTWLISDYHVWSGRCLVFQSNWSVPSFFSSIFYLFFTGVVFVYQDQIEFMWIIWILLFHFILFFIYFFFR